MDMGNKLASLRKQKGLSQLELAEAMNVSRQAVSMWESGATIPSIDNLVLLGRLYEVSVDEILGTAPAKQDSEKAENRAEKKPLRRLLIAAALALAALIIAVSAYLLGRSLAGEPSAGAEGEIIDASDMKRREIPDFEDIGVVPWVE